MFVYYFQAHIAFYSLHSTVISESVADVQRGYDHISTSEETDNWRGLVTLC